jgi:hypothetical protein
MFRKFDDFSKKINIFFFEDFALEKQEFLISFQFVFSQVTKICQNSFCASKSLGLDETISIFRVKNGEKKPFKTMNFSCF